MRQRQSFAIILVGKSILLREGLATILREANFRILASVSSADDLLPGKIRSQESLLLLVHTGNSFETAVSQIETLRNEHPLARIVMVADRYRLGEMVAALRAGANGYFVDVLTCDVFIRSLELVTLGQTPPAFVSLVLGPEEEQLDEQVARKEKTHENSITSAKDMLGPQLSAREKSILRSLIEGASNKSIARKFDLAEATVKVHVKAILRKIQVQNRTQAAIWGMNNEFLTQTANANALPSASDMSNRPPKVIGHSLRNQPNLGIGTSPD